MMDRIKESDKIEKLTARRTPIATAPQAGESVEKRDIQNGSNLLESVKRVSSPHSDLGGERLSFVTNKSQVTPSFITKRL